jgi:crossover junction endodeoxyribonuclease RuvC
LNTTPANEKIILGIDPGTIVMGYGVISCVGKHVSIVTLGILKLDKYEDYALKLKKIFERTIGIIDEYKPDELAIEAPFYGKNVQSMLKLGRAQGVAMAAAMSRELVINEYSPKKIKQSITGNGNASKEQVSSMLQHLLKFKYDDKFLDATDGLAAAYCHFMQSKLSVNGKKSKGNNWKSFITQNPGRVKK